VLEVFGSDIDRNIFFVPLGERKKQLEEMPWVESAQVMRLYPNHLRVAVKERTPVAFAEVNSRIALIDANGIIMDVPASQQGSYSFPVIVGISDAEPLSTRELRMKIYRELIKELDSNGAQYTRDLSEVNLSDPDDVKATVSDPHGAMLLHLGTSSPGASSFLERFRLYVAHVQEWRAQFPNLHSVDLRYEHQVIMNPDSASEQQPGAPAEKPAVSKNTRANHKPKTKQH
jgi:cell division protein FtsQ